MPAACVLPVTSVVSQTWRAACRGRFAPRGIALWPGVRAVIDGDDRLALGAAGTQLAHRLGRG